MFANYDKENLCVDDGQEWWLLPEEMGRVLFAPKQETDALQPVWTFDDGNSSILYPDMDDEMDLYGIPNVVEVMCSNADDQGGGVYYRRACPAFGMCFLVLILS